MHVSTLNFWYNSFTPILLLEVTNITSVGGQNILAPEQLILSCFTVPSDLPVVWVAINGIIINPGKQFFRDPFAGIERQLAEDPRAIIESTEYGSRLTLTNTTVGDSVEYSCRFIQRDAFSLANIFVPVIPGNYLCLSICIVK